MNNAHARQRGTEVPHRPCGRVKQALQVGARVAVRCRGGRRLRFGNRCLLERRWQGRQLHLHASASKVRQHAWATSEVPAHVLQVEHRWHRLW